MKLDSVETREIELELVLPGWNGLFPTDCPHLGVNYFFEDMREQDRGLVISADMQPTGNLEQAINEFLIPILNSAEILKNFSPILHAAVYNRAFTCSLSIKCLPLLIVFGAEVDIIVYPTAEENES